MYQAQDYALTLRYDDELCRRIGVLQQLQTLVSNDATLNDVVLLLQNFQQEFGLQESLECVIQSLVGRSLKEQIIHRKGGKQCSTNASRVLQPS